MNIPTNNEFYSQSIKEFGISAQGVRWNNKHSQYKRFEIITKRIRKHIKTATVVDVGCGFAEYFGYLKANQKEPLKYIGIDCEEDMINISKKRFPDQEFYLADVLKDKLIYGDYLICSGALNILKYEQIEPFIAKCYAYSNKGFIFNTLRELTFNGVKPDQVIDICKKYSDNISTYDGYLENDFTIQMLK